MTTCCHHLLVVVASLLMGAVLLCAEAGHITEGQAPMVSELLSEAMEEVIQEAPEAAASHDDPPSMGAVTMKAEEKQAQVDLAKFHVNEKHKGKSTRDDHLAKEGVVATQRAYADDEVRRKAMADAKLSQERKSAAVLKAAARGVATKAGVDAAKNVAHMAALGVAKATAKTKAALKKELHARGLVK